MIVHFLIDFDDSFYLINGIDIGYLYTSPSLAFNAPITVATNSITNNAIAAKTKPIMVNKLPENLEMSKGVTSPFIFSISDKLIPK